MPRKMYPSAAQKLWEGEFDWVNDTIKVALLSATYVYSDAHDFHNDLSGIVATHTLTGKSNSLGILDADNPVLVIAPSSPITQAVIYKDSGVSATSPLMFFLDSANGLPFTPDGSELELEWFDGPNKMINQGDCT